MKKKAIVLVAIILVLAIIAGATLAYLTDTSEKVVNTFTVGNVKIDLTETDVENDGSLLANSYKMVPGNKIDKDPTIIVEKGSEKAYVFVEIEESASLDKFITYTVDGSWTKLNEGLYYQVVDALEATENIEISVLKDDVVTVNNVTQADMDGITAGTTPAPTLSFKGYAIQHANIVVEGNDSPSPEQLAAAAWTALNA